MICGKDKNLNNASPRKLADFLFFIVLYSVEYRIEGHAVKSVLIRKDQE